LRPREISELADEVAKLGQIKYDKVDPLIPPIFRPICIAGQERTVRCCTCKNCALPYVIEAAQTPHDMERCNYCRPLGSGLNNDPNMTDDDAIRWFQQHFDIAIVLGYTCPFIQMVMGRLAAFLVQRDRQDLIRSYGAPPGNPSDAQYRMFNTHVDRELGEVYSGLAFSGSMETLFSATVTKLLRSNVEPLNIDNDMPSLEDIPPLERSMPRVEPS